MREVMTVQQACERTSLSDKTIYRALESRALIGCKVGTAWRIFGDDLEAWLVSLQRGPQAAHGRPRRGRHPAPAARGSLRALEAVDQGGTG
jgi:excisionase family DNA binding protein